MPQGTDQPAAEAGAAHRGRRQLVLCFDGTNNNLTGRAADTNVVKLLELLAPEPGRQLVYYDPGVGNPANIPGVTFWDKWKGKAERLWGLAFGKGIYENMAEAYLFLMRQWQAGDDLYVFGFSRGAFTARSVAGMVARFGILDRSMEGLVPTLVHLYFADYRKAKARYDAIRAQIGQSFCTPEGARASVWFVGVWDTVESVGAPFSRRRIQASSSIIGKRFQHVRQALALDEHRRSFSPRPYYVHPTHDYAATGQSIRQLWWSGAHSDVGGGYTQADALLSDRCLLWMAQQAWEMGLRLSPRVLHGDGTFDLDAAAAAMRAGASQGPPRPALVHSETFSEAYWALSGLGVRDFHLAFGEPGDPPPLPPRQQPAPAEPPLQLQHGTVMRPAFALRIAGAALAALVFSLLHGAAISGDTLLAGMRGWTDVQGLLDGMARLWQANADFARWQLLWWQQGADAYARMPVALPHPLWAFWADLALILSYGYLLAQALSRGFANWAGLRNVHQPPPRLLNLLGWSGALIVFADLAENLLTLGVLAAAWLGWPPVQAALAGLMSLASALKWFGFLPAAALAARAIR